MNESKQHFKRTRKRINTLRAKRNRTRQKGKTGHIQGRSQRYQGRKTTTQGLLRNTRGFSNKSDLRRDYPRRSNNSLNHKLFIENKLQAPNRKTYNRLRDTMFGSKEWADQGLIHNYSEYEEPVSIKPPATSSGVDQFGEFVTLMGSEALTRLKVRPQSTGNLVTPEHFTLPGDIIDILILSKSYMANTRFRLLSEMYQYFKVVNLKLEFQPMQAATFSGGIVVATALDPDSPLNVGADSDTRLDRAIDYSGSRSFNVYNHVDVTLPVHPEDTEPFSVIGGIDAREEIPYVIYVLAQSSFQPAVDEDETTIYQVVMHYEVKFYSMTLPPMSVDNSDNTYFYNDVFANAWASNAVGDPVQGVVAAFNMSGATQQAKVGVMYCITDLVDDIGNLLQWDSGTTGPISLSQGQVIYFKREKNLNTGITRVFFYPNLDAVYRHNDLFVWSVSPSSALTIQFWMRLQIFDLDSVL